MPFVIFTLTILVSFAGFMYMDSRQQEVRLSIVEHRVEEVSKRVDRVVRMIMKQYRATAEESYERGGP